MIRAILLILSVAILAGCILFSSATPAETPIPPERTQTIVRSVPPLQQYGEFSLEERILNTNTIVRATMNSFSSEVVVDLDEKYRAVLKYNFTVREYLKGSGPTSVVGVAVDGQPYDTRTEAESARARMLTARDAQWDDREAIVFLYNSVSGFGPVLDAQFQQAAGFLLAVGNRYSGDDRYSLHSKENKAWLPAATSGISASETDTTEGNQEFLLDLPSTSGEEAGVSSVSSASTITLSSLKGRISAVTTELNGGDGSEAYKECVEAKYRLERRDRYWQELDGTKSYNNSPTASELSSGQPANTGLHGRLAEGWYPDQTGKGWLEGGDAALFAVVLGEKIAFDVDGDGKITSGVDGIKYTKTLTTARPLPAGEYKTVRKDVWTAFLPCNYVLSNDWTITVTSPTGTLHEAFFDPVAIGTTIGADATNGVLKPNTFTASDSTTTTLRSVDYSGSNVRMLFSQTTGLSGKEVQLIMLDGTVGLTVPFSSATTETVASQGTRYSWKTCSAPWAAGEKVMIRIRSASGSTSSTPSCIGVIPTATPVP